MKGGDKMKTYKVTQFIPGSKYCLSEKWIAHGEPDVINVGKFVCLTFKLENGKEVRIIGQYFIIEEM